MESGGAFAWNKLVDHKFTLCKFVFSVVYSHYLCLNLKTAACATQLIATCCVVSIVQAGLAEVGSSWWLLLSAHLSWPFSTVSAWFCFYLFAFSPVFLLRGEMNPKTWHVLAIEQENHGSSFMLLGQQPPDVSSWEVWAPSLLPEIAWFWQEQRGKTTSQTWTKPLT